MAALHILPPLPVIRVKPMQIIPVRSVQKTPQCGDIGQAHVEALGTDGWHLMGRFADQHTARRDKFIGHHRRQRKYLGFTQEFKFAENVMRAMLQVGAFSNLSRLQPLKRWPWISTDSDGSA